MSDIRSNDLRQSAAGRQMEKWSSMQGYGRRNCVTLADLVRSVCGDETPPVGATAWTREAIALHEERRPARREREEEAARVRLVEAVYGSYAADLSAFPSPDVRPCSPEDARWQECSRRVSADQVVRALSVRRLRARLDARREAAVRAAQEEQAVHDLRVQRARDGRERRLLAGIEEPLRAAYAECGYRRAESRWVGGKHTLTLHVTDRMHPDPTCDGASTEIWHRKHAWRGMNSCHTLRVRPSWLADVQEPGLAVVGGLLTLDAHPLQQDDTTYRAWSATWVEQGRGVEIRSGRGVIVRLLSTGETLHGATLAGALRTLRAREREQRIQRLDSAVREQLSRGEVGDLGAIIVTIADSLRAGNCDAGTRSWVERHMPGRESATVAEVLAVGDRSEAVLRAVLHAVRRAQSVSQQEVAHA